MLAIRELLTTSTLLALLSVAAGDGPARVLLMALSMLAWAQAVSVAKLIGIRISAPVVA